MRKSVDNTDYIRNLTNSLASGGSNSAPGTAPANDQVSLGTTIDTSSTLLYKYGHDTASVSNKLLPNSIPSLGGKPKTAGAINSSLSVLSENTDAYIEKLRSGTMQTTTEVVPTYGGNIGENQAHMNFLINIEKNRNRSGKLVSGSQFRMPMKEVSHRCETCEVFNKTNKNLKETIRSLKLQIARQEEKMHMLKMSKNSDHLVSLSKTENFSASDFNNNENRSDYDILKQRCDHFEDEVNKLKKVLAFERHTNETIKKSFEDTKGALNLEIVDHKNAYIALTNEYNAMKAANKAQETTIESLNASLLSYKQQLEKSENKLSDCLIRLKASNQSASDLDNIKEIARLKAELAASELGAQTINSSLLQANNALKQSENKLKLANSAVLSLEGTVEAKEADLKKVSGDLKSSQDEAANAKKRCEVLEGLLKSTTSERDGFSNTLNLRDADLSLANQRIAMMDTETQSLKNKIADLLRRMGADSENTKKALEKAISASVRLCVVAPTVNVHVADKKLKFKAGLSEASLKEFLNSEVLDKYSFLFKQKADNAAPNGQDLESWLQKMLSQMQTSIESHVNSAMDGSSL